MPCIGWDMKGVLYYELLKPGKTATAELYRQQVIKVNKKIEEKRSYTDRGKRPVKFLYDSSRPHEGKLLKDVLMAL